VNTVPRVAGAPSHALPATPRNELVLGRFRLIEPLGSGGHGTVWEAYDERLRRTVALKRITCAHDAQRDDHRRIDREALAAARLSHPAIVAFHEALSDHDAYYLVSEIVRGASLAKRYAGARPSDRELIAIGVALADALGHAHARGVIHRDVKPQNVIIAVDASETGAHAKLTDFGVAQIAGEQPLTRTGDVVGTLAYMAPEQADGRQASPATDLYALALTLYEGFAGENPLRGATAVATVKRLSQGIPPLAAKRPELPRRLIRAIDRALSIDPAERGSLEDLRDALASLTGGNPKRSATLRQPSHPPDRPS
jgi:serine/threonine protein kinase